MQQFLDVWIFGVIAATAAYATPLVLAGLGGLLSERAGIVNIGLEGMMISGAFFTIYGADVGGSWAVGLICGIIAGAVYGLLHAIACVTFHSDQIISGTAIVLLAAGLTNFLFISLYGGGATPSDVSLFPAVPNSVPIVGGLNGIVFLALLLVWGVSFVVFQTPFGLHLRSVGEHPRAAETVGIDVVRMRYIAVISSGALAGMAGAYIAFEAGNYRIGMTAGKGFIALAALIFGKWRPRGVLIAALIFGVSSALASRLSGVSWLPEVIANEALLNSLPYVVTIVALAGFVGHSQPPAAVGKPYIRH